MSHLIDYAKKKIKELYMTGYVYNLDTIVNYIKDTYNVEKKDLFYDFFVQKDGYRILMNFLGFCRVEFKPSIQWS
jgi:ABC-type Fe3+ transport system substrate-binding protein